jgi:hypothetical protein
LVLTLLFRQQPVRGFCVVFVDDGRFHLYFEDQYNTKSLGAQMLTGRFRFGTNRGA